MAITQQCVAECFCGFILLRRAGIVTPTGSKGQAMRKYDEVEPLKNILRRMKVGDEFVYHEGPWCDGPYANDAWTAYEAHRVVLYQRRIPESSVFQYCMKKVR